MGNYTVDTAASADKESMAGMLVSSKKGARKIMKRGRQEYIIKRMLNWGEFHEFTTKDILALLLEKWPDSDVKMATNTVSSLISAGLIYKAVGKGRRGIYSKRIREQSYDIQKIVDTLLENMTALTKAAEYYQERYIQNETYKEKATKYDLIMEVAKEYG